MRILNITIRTKQLTIALLVAVLMGCVSNPPSGSAVGYQKTDFTYENTNQQAVVNQIVSETMATGLAVTRADDFIVVAEGMNTSVGAMLLYGSKYDRTPAMRVTYNIATAGGNDVRVKGIAQMITNPGSAFERTNEFTVEASGYINRLLSRVQTNLSGDLAPTQKAEAQQVCWGPTSPSEIETALRASPRDPCLWHLLAQARLNMGETGNARNLAKRSNDLAGQNEELNQANLRIIREATK